MARPVLSIALVLLSSGTTLSAASPLFPQPLHLTRQVHDPISGSTIALQEYGYGNRLITVRGALVTIADYEKSELTEIDRDAGTYSVTRFEAIAKAVQAFNPPAATTERSARRMPRSLGAKPAKIGHSAEFFQDDIESKPAKRSIEVGVDRSVTVSRDALEVLLGSAFPGTRRIEHDVVLAAASGTSESAYALPVEQIIQVEADGEKLEFRSSILRVGNEVPPADVVSIPTGARLVVSRMIAVQRELEQFDHPPLPPPRKP